MERKRKNLSVLVITALLLVSIVALAFGFNQIRSKMKAKDNEIATMLTAIKSRQDTDTSQQDKMIASLKASLSNAMTQNNDLNDKINALNSQMQALEQTINDKNTQINSITVNRARLESDLNKKISDYEKKLSSAEGNLESLEQEIENTKNEYANYEASAKEQMQMLNDDIESLTQDRENLTEQMVKLQKNRLVKETAKMHYNLANHFIEAQKYEEAEKEYQQALRLNEVDADTHYNLALLFDIYYNDFAKAVHHYQRCLEINPRYKKRKEIERRILDLQLSDAVDIDPTWATSPRLNSFNSQRINAPETQK